LHRLSPIQVDHRVLFGGDVDQRPVLDVLQVAAARRRDVPAGAVHIRDQQRGVARVGSHRRVAGLQLDGPGEVADDAGDHLRLASLPAKRSSPTSLPGSPGF
jgi:hypothetical protein